MTEHPIAKPTSEWWTFGTRVCKINGSSWHGHIVGYYKTSATPEGYAVESEREPGSVQIYPRAALECVDILPDDNDDYDDEDCWFHGSDMEARG